MLLQAAAHAHQGAAGAQPGNEHVDVGQGFDDLRTGGLVVGVGIAGVPVLVQHEIVAAPLGHQVLSDFDGPVGASGAVGGNDLGPVGLEQLHPLGADVLRHDHGDFIALQPADHRQ